tara:strand:- start:850 stop:1221 length:372 start_codon:yes stop_codon:yes gene_type:complete
MEDTENETSSFAVVVTPDFEDTKWTGSISAYVEEEVLGDLEPEELKQIRNVVAMMASTLTLMENDPEFLGYIKNYFAEHYQHLVEGFVETEEEEEEESPKSFIRSKEGNVITLNFNTKTHGNA